MTSRDEDNHIVLKKQLRSFLKNLKIVMNNINLLLMNELHTYLLDLNDVKTQYSANCRKLIFQSMSVYVFFSMSWRRFFLNWNCWQVHSRSFRLVHRCSSQRLIFYAVIEFKNDCSIKNVYCWKIYICIEDKWFINQINNKINDMNENF